MFRHIVRAIIASLLVSKTAALPSYGRARGRRVHVAPMTSTPPGRRLHGTPTAYGQ